ncbi:MAG: hypothetical protein MUF24_06260 [Chitinophagaceae bacterium]|nr:hypothetical protein [Chitinophagaceae bacterium]
MSSQIFTATMDDTWNPADDGQQALGSTMLANFTSTATNFALALPNGQLILASGDSYNQTRVFGLARTNANGQLDATFTVPNNLFSRVFNTLALQPDGKILAGGRVEFSFASGLPANNLHRYNPDGSYDAGFTQGTHDLAGTIKKILVLPNGNILVAGSFTTYNGVAAGGLVRLLPSGEIDAAYNIGSGAVGGSIEDMLLQPDGKIIIAGSFTAFNGTAVNRLARLHADGSLDATFTGTASNTVFSIASMSGNRLLVAGNFTSVTGVLRNRVAVLSQNGTTDNVFGASLSLANGIVNKAIELSDGSIMVAGQFTTFNGQPRPSHARLTETGTIVASYSTEPNGATGGAITGLLQQPEGNIVLTGSFLFLQRINFGGITRITTGGFIDPTFNPNGGAGGATGRWVSCMERMADGRLVIGGRMGRYNGIPTYNVTRLLADGAPDPSFDAGIEGPVSDIRALAVQPDNKIIIAGSFSRVDQVARPGLARLLENGRLDTDFNPEVMNTFASSDVRVIKLLPDGKMYIGGEFQKIGSNTNLKYLARLMPNGLPDPSFTPPIFAGSFGRVNAIAVMDDGKIVVGGSGLELPLESTRRSILRLNTDGSYDASFNGGNPGFDVNSNPVVEGLLKSGNNRLIVWGNFFSYNAQSRRYLVALNLDGTLVTPNPYAALPTNFIVPDNIIEQPNGRLLVTGDFTYSASGIPGTFPGLFRLLPTGAFDANFRIGSGFGLSNGASYDALFTKLVDHSILLGNKLLVCGGFTVFNGVARNRVARINLGDVITPVTWLSFTATASSSGAVLQWRTANEQQNRGFEVQRSGDGQNYTSIAFVPAAGTGNSNTPQSYQFTENKLVPGTHFYRLRQTDTDGSFAYSEVRTVVVGVQDVVTIFPNPVTATFSLMPVATGIGTLRFVDATGKVLTQQNVATQAGIPMQVRRPALTKGMYWLQLQYPNSKLLPVTLRFVVQ